VPKIACSRIRALENSRDCANRLRSATAVQITIPRPATLRHVRPNLNFLVAEAGTEDHLQVDDRALRIARE